MSTRPTSSTSSANNAAGIDLTESAAGEEDPGASIDLAMTPGGSGGLTGQGDKAGAGQAPMRPGDQAPPDTPGTGENVCPACGGSGRQGASPCPACQGTGKITVGIGGA